MYRPNYYLSLMEFRDLTLRRLQKFVDQKFFSTFDYLNGEPHVSLVSSSLAALCKGSPYY